MDLGLSKRRALVMGGSRGMGRAIAKTLVEEGAQVAICARDEARLKKSAAEIGARPFPADLSKPDAARLLVERVTAEFGAPDILLVNTGGPTPGTFDRIDDQTWRAGFEGLWMSCVQGIRASLPHMKRQRWGRVLVLTSIAAREPLANIIVSNALRAGLHGLVNALSKEVAADGITVNALVPGYTMTERIAEIGYDVTKTEAMIPMHRFARPDEPAALAAFLVSEKAGYITGEAIAVDGGYLQSI